MENNTQEYIDMLNKQQYDLLLDLLSKKDQRITELEQELAKYKELQDQLGLENADEFEWFVMLDLLTDNEKNMHILDLHRELAELKEKAIVPKFKTGQECYLIDNNFNYFKNTKEFNIVCSNIKKQQNWYYVKDYGVYHENDLFATEQEAQTKLQELRGGE